ncbi:MAG: phospho-sugar mutase, partial [Bacteroidota bacterium]
EIAAMMEGFRKNTPSVIDGVKVIQLLDYQLQKGKNLANGTEWDIDLPKSNVLQFILEDGSKISARPSGTEPKIKFYFSVRDSLASISQYEEVYSKLKNKIGRIITDLQLK